MFDAREWLKEIEQAARLAEAETRWLEAQRMLALRLGAPTTRIHTGISDPMRPIDDLMDGERERRDAMDSALAEIEAARAVFSGMRTVGALEHEAASMMELVHIGLATKKDAAEALGISYDAGKRAYRYGVEWLDSHGLAFAKAGKGLAQ
ncbi:MAG: hypothetical protein IJV91_03520 [Kiritimatiellae bacterium]|nr:hypothetical protein [Kiritimatiellia bacterium]